jgi:hypothetical protein
VFAGLNRVFRIAGGALTYPLTNNERPRQPGTRVPVRNRHVLTFGLDHGISVLTCEPGNLATKGGMVNAVKLAKADIVAT